MDELVSQITSRTGVPDAVARQIIPIVAGFIKDKLPGPLAGQVDNILGTSGNTGTQQQNQGGLGGALGGLFGGNQQ